MSHQVISFDYVLTARGGQVIDASAKGKPLAFIPGLGQIIPGLETVLLGMQLGEKKTVTIAAKDAYGAIDSRLIYKVERSKLPTQDVKVGDMFEAGEAGHYTPVVVTAMDGQEVTLDGNHPLAGQDLTFAVEVVEKRPASPEESAQGSVGAQGHCHDGDCGCQH